MTKLQVFDAITALIQRMAADRDTIWSFGAHIRSDGGTHATDAMKDDGIDFPDLLYVLRNGVVVRSEVVEKYDELRYRVVGRNVDGVRMTFIVTIRESTNTIEVVTAWMNR